MRPETGPMQFGHDWPGVFIRGDDAKYFSGVIRQFLLGMDETFLVLQLKHVADALSSCDMTLQPVRPQKAQLVLEES